MKVTFTNKPSTGGPLLGPVIGKHDADSGLATSHAVKIVPVGPLFSDEELIAQIRKNYPNLTDEEIAEQIRLFG